MKDLLEDTVVVLGLISKPDDSKIKKTNFLISLLQVIMLFCAFGCQIRPILNLSITPLKKGAILDPSQINFLNEYYIIENLTVRLVEMDAKAGYKLMLASEIKQITPLEYLIKIKDSGFSNGDKIELKDVRDSLLRAKKGINSHVAFGDMAKSITIENNAIKIKLKKKVNDFLYFLSLADLSVLHSSQIKVKELTVENWEEVSSGPFYYSVQGEDVFLLKNKHFKLSSINYPEKIKLVGAKGRDTFQDFKNKIVDFGEFNLNSFEKHLKELTETKNLQVTGNNGDMINYFALNVKHPKFQKEYNRQWLQKKILLNYSLDPKYNNVARKAFQFFTPFVKGFVEERKIIAEVESWSHIDINKTPNELKGGITISTYERAFEVSLRGAFVSLEKVLGFPIKIQTNVPSSGFKGFIEKRDFEVFLGITSMDQVIVGESINFQYFSASPMFQDVNDKIGKLMKLYLLSDSSKTVGIVNEIAFQMVRDSECVPVFYVASPFFYNKDKLDVSGLDEMTYFNLWKIKVL